MTTLHKARLTRYGIKVYHHKTRTTSRYIYSHEVTILHRGDFGAYGALHPVRYHGNLRGYVDTDTDGYTLLEDNSIWQRTTLYRPLSLDWQSQLPLTTHSQNLIKRVMALSGTPITYWTMPRTSWLGNIKLSETAAPYRFATWARIGMDSDLNTYAFVMRSERFGHDGNPHFTGGIYQLNKSEWTRLYAMFQLERLKSR